MSSPLEKMSERLLKCKTRKDRQLTEKIITKLGKTTKPTSLSMIGQRKAKYHVHLWLWFATPLIIATLQPLQFNLIHFI